jgi:hypothetical protein
LRRLFPAPGADGEPALGPYPERGPPACSSRDKQLREE